MAMQHAVASYIPSCRHLFNDVSVTLRSLSLSNFPIWCIYSYFTSVGYILTLCRYSTREILLYSISISGQNVSLLPDPHSVTSFLVCLFARFIFLLVLCLGLMQDLHHSHVTFRQSNGAVCTLSHTYMCVRPMVVGGGGGATLRTQLYDSPICNLEPPWYLNPVLWVGFVT